jgi:hypothetical protein
LLHPQLACINLVPVVESENEASPPTDTCLVSSTTGKAGRVYHHHAKKKWKTLHLGVL